MRLRGEKKLVYAFAAALLALASACQNPASSSGSGNSGSSVTTGSTGSSGTTDTSQIGFESGYNVSGVTATESDVTGGTMGMAFSLSTAQVHAGSQSLECTGTSQRNAYSTDYFGEASIPVPSAPVDFTNKPVSVAIYVPSGSAISAVNLCFLDTNNKQTLIQQQNTTPGSWVVLTFSPAAANINYQDTGADLTHTNTLRLRFETTNASGAVSAAIDAFVDAINW